MAIGLVNMEAVSVERWSEHLPGVGQIENGRHELENMSVDNSSVLA